MWDDPFGPRKLIEGNEAGEDEIDACIQAPFPEDCLLEEDEAMEQQHTFIHEPWEVLEYCDAQEDLYDLVIDHTEPQEQNRKEGEEET